MAIHMITPEERLEEQRRNAAILAERQQVKLEAMSAIQYFFKTLRVPPDFH